MMDESEMPWAAGIGASATGSAVAAMYAYASTAEPPGPTVEELKSEFDVVKGGFNHAKHALTNMAVLLSDAMDQNGFHREAARKTKLEHDACTVELKLEAEQLNACVADLVKRLNAAERRVAEAVAVPVVPQPPVAETAKPQKQWFYGTTGERAEVGDLIVLTGPRSDEASWRVATDRVVSIDDHGITTDSLVAGEIGGTEITGVRHTLISRKKATVTLRDPLPVFELGANQYIPPSLLDPTNRSGAAKWLVTSRVVMDGPKHTIAYFYHEDAARWFAANYEGEQ